MEFLYLGYFPSYSFFFSPVNTFFTRFHKIRNSKTGFAGRGPVAMLYVEIPI